MNHVFEYPKSPIAICGIGCRFPGDANSPADFWKLLQQGKDAIGPIPKDRWDADALFDPNHKTSGKIHIREGGFINRIDEFDAAFFGIAPIEAHSMDPAHRLLLEHTYMALEDAGEQIEKLEGTRTGVFVGTSSSEYAGIMQNYSERANIGAHTNTGSSPAITANRISYVFDFHGPSFAIDTACSASLLAAHLACRSIWQGESTAAIVAGVNLMLKPELHIGFSTAGFLSADARSRSFDARANGYVRSEGVGVLYLKPLDKAIADGNQIYATIIGSATNEDGRTAGIALPNPDAQVAVMQDAYRDAGIPPNWVTVVEAHGTGTAAGDPLECQSIGAVIGANRSDNCLIGSVKSNIGHTELASGSAGLIKLALSLRNGFTPPTVHFTTPNPAIDFDGLHIRVSNQLLPIPKKDGVIYGGINSFGFGGANVHLVLKSYEQRRDEHKTTETFPVILPISARSDAALRLLANEYRQLLRQDSTDVRELAKQAALKRSHLEIRAAVCAVDKRDALARLSDVARGNPHPQISLERPSLAKGGKVAFVFSGQGPQWFAMGRQLLQNDATFRETIEEVNSHLQKLGWLADENSSLIDELLKDEASSRVHLTHIVQPALFALQVGLARVWKRLGVEPDMVVGHSIGEVAAATISGALSMETAVQVVFWRSRCQSMASGRGRMMAVGLSKEDALAHIDLFHGKIDIAAINGPAMLTLAGDSEALERLAEMLKPEKIFHRFLVVDVPFHSYLLDDVTQAFINDAPPLAGSENAIPMYSTVTAEKISGTDINREYWAKNIRNSVLFYPVVEKMVDDGATTFIEISPNPILAHGVKEAFTARQAKGIIVPTLRKGDEEAMTIARSLATLHVNGFPVNWHKVYSQVANNANIPLPVYPWQRERFWMESEQGKRDRIASRVHPHLMRKIAAADNPNDIIWEVELDARNAPYITDHRVQGPVVYPGAGHVDLAIAAGRASFGDGFGFVEDIEFITPLFLKDKGTPFDVQIHIDTDDGRFFIASRESEPVQGPWTIHSKGKLNHIGDRFNSTPVTLAVLQSRIDEPVELAPLFETLQKGGLELGPIFKGIEQLFRRENEALGKIRVHPDILPTMNQFNLHPALLDAAFQSAFGIIEDRSRMGVYIPKKIGKVKFYGPPKGNAIYSYARAARNESETILADIWIFSENGKLIAEVKDFLGKYLKGSRGEVDGELDTLFFQTKYHPAIRKSTLQKRNPATVLSDLKSVQNSLTQTVRDLKSESQFIPFLESLAPAMDQLALGYVCKAFDDLGAPLQPMAEYEADHIKADLRIAPRQERLFDSILHQLRNRGILQLRHGKYVVPSTVPVPPIHEILNRAKTDLKPFASEIDFFKHAGESLAAVLTGDTDPAEVLFAENRWNEIIDYYSTAYSMDKYNRMVQSAIGCLTQKDTTAPLRILEIGGGTGGVTQAILPVLADRNAEYVFTDISPTFLERAQKRFATYSHVHYQTLDIEKDPEQQGHLLSSFDLVIASNVLHATADIRKTLANAHALLAPGGVLCLLEVTSVPFYVDLSFGMTDGWWRFNDDVRTSRCTLSGEKWLSTLAESGFTDAFESVDVEDGPWPRQSIFIARAKERPTAAEPKFPDRQWIVAGDNKGVSQRIIDELQGRNEIFLLADKANLNSWLEETLGSTPKLPLRMVYTAALDISALGNGSCDDALSGSTEVLVQLTTIAAFLIERQIQNVRIDIVTHNVCGAIPEISQSPIWGFSRVMRNELSDAKVRVIDIAALAPDIQDSLIDELFDDAEEEEEVSLERGLRRVTRMTPVSQNERHWAAAKKIDIRGKHIQLLASDAGIIQQCRFVPQEPPSIAKDEVSIEIQYTGLNFRDVMVAGGALVEEARDGGIFGAQLGLECTGVVTEVGSHVSHIKPGDAVMSIARGSLAGRTVAKASFTRKLPAHISPKDGSAVPMALITAYTALFRLAQLHAGSRVLIHSAAGGVGLVAVHLAKAAGATVFATASVEKHEFLRQAGVQYVYNSRDTLYYSDIMADTDGAGVDIVLNSLTGPHITQSLKLLAPMGTFVEIGKVDLYQDRRIGIRLLANNISYHALDIDRLLALAPDKMSSIFDDALEFLRQHGWPALPIECIPFAEATAALSKMATGTHVGKIVMESGAVLVSPKERLVLRDDASYLIAGGTRGLGLSVASMLVEKGARFITLISRSGMHGEEEMQRVLSMQKMGAQIDIVAVDICDEAAVRELIRKTHRIGKPLAGVFQSTLVLDDALLHTMTSAQLAAPLQPKIRGTWNLHRATEHIPLDYFVSFSSVSSLYGLPGQANYAAANRFLDDFALWRQAQGLPASTVNLGPLAETGFVAREEKVHDYLHLSGWQPLSTSEALKALERILLEGPPQRGVYRLDWQKMQAAFPQLAASTRFEGIRAHLSTQQTDSDNGNTAQSLASASPARRKELIRQLLAEVMEKILGIERAKIDFEQPINRMGMDSLMSNQLRSVLTRQTGMEFSLMQIMQGPRLSELANEIESRLQPLSDAGSASTEAVWARPIVRRRHAKMRLFTLPYLGAGASIFSGWRLSSDIEICPIQLPGREERSHEPPIHVGEELIAAMAQGIQSQLDIPFAIYGHSYGGNLAMSLESYLEGKYQKTARHIFIGAAIPPGINNPLEHEFKITDSEDALNLSSQKMRALLERIGTPPSLLENEDRFEAMLPALRADLAITRQRLYPKDHVLQAPITAFAAQRDHLYSVDLVGQWQRFSERFELIPVAGSHLFLHESEARGELLRSIGKVLHETAMVDDIASRIKSA